MTHRVPSMLTGHERRQGKDDPRGAAQRGAATGRSVRQNAT
jgi:hypothetical protein